jgi:hypothetical protein
MRLSRIVLSAVLFLAGLSCIEQGVSGAFGKAQTSAQIITCSTLGGVGPGDNEHVTITEFHACTDLIVVSGGDMKSHWEQAFIPLVPASDPKSKNFHVVLDSTSITNPQELATLNNKNEVTGVINGLVKGPSDQAKGLLQDSYPDVNLGTCYFVNHEMRAISRTGGILLIVTGLVLFGVFVLVIKKTPAATSNAPAGPVSQKFRA